MISLYSVCTSKHFIQLFLNICFPDKSNSSQVEAREKKKTIILVVKVMLNQ